MTDYYYGQDILTDVLFRGGERQDLTGGISDYLAATKKYVMRAYYDILGDYPWPTALADPPGIINTVAKVTGTATCTEGSTSVTLSATVAASMAERKFYIESEAIPYRITAHTAGTDAVTLDAPYKEATTTSSYTVYQDEYSLASDAISVWGPAWDRNNPYQPIEVISNKMDADTRNYGVGSESNNVTEITFIRGNKIKVRPWTSDAKTIEYEYIPRPSTLTWDSTATDVPVIDEESRFVIADYALYFLLKDKKDAGATEAMTVAQAFISKMKMKHVRQQKPRLYPKPGSGIWR